MAFKVETRGDLYTKLAAELGVNRDIAKIVFYQVMHNASAHRIAKTLLGKDINEYESGPLGELNNYQKAVIALGEAAIVIIKDYIVSSHRLISKELEINS